MLASIVNAIKSALLVAIILGLLAVLGKAIQTYLPWNYLGYALMAIYQLLDLFDFMIDVDTLWICLGWIFQVHILIMMFRAGMAVISRFTGSQD